MPLPHSLSPASAAILFVASGTTDRTAAAVYDRISVAAAVRFPGVAIRWAFTSAMVVRRLEASGTVARAPEAALDALGYEGIRQVAVVPLHLTEGREFSALATTMAQWRATDAPPRAALGRPLLTDFVATRRLVAALPTVLPRPLAADEALILVAHGTPAVHGAAVYAAAAVQARTVDPRLLLSVQTGTPGLAEIVRICRDAGYARAWLLPFTVTAGTTARQAVIDDGPGSWRSELARQGILCTPLLRGLGDCDALRAYWLDQAAALLDGRGGPAPPPLI